MGVAQIEQTERLSADRLLVEKIERGLLVRRLAVVHETVDRQVQGVRDSTVAEQNGLFRQEELEADLTAMLDVNPFDGRRAIDGLYGRCIVVRFRNENVAKQGLIVDGVVQRREILFVLAVGKANAIPRLRTFVGPRRRRRARIRWCRARSTHGEATGSGWPPRLVENSGCMFEWSE